jgi:hypothetical protein
MSKETFGNCRLVGTGVSFIRKGVQQFEIGIKEMI